METGTKPEFKYRGPSRTRAGLFILSDRVKQASRLVLEGGHGEEVEALLKEISEVAVECRAEYIRWQGQLEAGLFLEGDPEAEGITGIEYWRDRAEEAERWLANADWRELLDAAMEAGQKQNVSLQALHERLDGAS